MRRPAAFRSVSWFGDAAEPSAFVAVPPRGYERYRVTGSLRVASDAEAPDLEHVDVVDVDTGARALVRGEMATLTLSGELNPDYVRRLWMDARYLTGLAAKLGRPPDVAARVADYRRAVLALRSEGWGRYPTIDKVLEYLGSDKDERQVRRDIGMPWRRWLGTID